MGEGRRSEHRGGLKPRVPHTQPTPPRTAEHPDDSGHGVWPEGSPVALEI